MQLDLSGTTCQWTSDSLTLTSHTVAQDVFFIWTTAQRESVLLYFRIFLLTYKPSMAKNFNDLPIYLIYDAIVV